jgi:hypothetical protein
MYYPRRTMLKTKRWRSNWLLFETSRRQWCNQWINKQCTSVIITGSDFTQKIVYSLAKAIAWFNSWRNPNKENVSFQTNKSFQTKVLVDDSASCWNYLMYTVACRHCPNILLSCPCWLFCQSSPLRLEHMKTKNRSEYYMLFFNLIKYMKLVYSHYLKII